MNIVIVGAGEVGYAVAEELSEEKHSIVVVEENEGKAQRVKENLDVKSVSGNGA
ncbi:MAG: NAD-binding protein, partial [Synergistes sp.]|nr:NAD-binding protein [Synergistes sp.]